MSIYRNRGEVFSIETRIDVRKFDSVLLSGLLALADSWSCTLVETRYRKVCRMGLEDFRAFLAGHPHCRAMKEPDIWFPALADEVKRAEGEP